MRNLLVIAFVLSACGQREDNREVVYRVQFFCGDLAWDLRAEAKAYRSYIAARDAHGPDPAMDDRFAGGLSFGRRTHDGRVAAEHTLQRELLFCERALGRQSAALDNELSAHLRTMAESDDPIPVADAIEQMAARATEMVTPPNAE